MDAVLKNLKILIDNEIFIEFYLINVFLQFGFCIFSEKSLSTNGG